jgi:hypothetical protein
MKDPKDQESKVGDSGKYAASGENRSGRVGFDERGNSVWEWQLEGGVYSRDVTTQKLKKLDLDELSIADTATHPRPPGFTPDAKPGSGFNPYDSTPQVGGGTSPYDTAHAVGDKFRDKPTERPKRTLDDMRKLSDAIKREKGEQKK